MVTIDDINMCMSRGVTGYQILGGQLVMRRNAARRRWPVAPSILPKNGWAIAHPAHLPVTPLNGVDYDSETPHTGTFYAQIVQIST